MSAQHTPTPMAMVVAAARALCDQHASMCNVNADDLWNLESEGFKEDAEKALEACGALELLEALQALVNDKQCDPNKARSNAGRWTTINARSEDLERARAVIHIATGGAS